MTATAIGSVATNLVLALSSVSGVAPTGTAVSAAPFARPIATIATRRTSIAPIDPELCLGQTVTPWQDSSALSSVTRPTTPQEAVIGEIRSWILAGANWDGEGAVAPSAKSIKEAVAFLRLLPEDINLPEPMLLPSGRAALFWHSNELYADLEFSGSGRIPYFIKKNEDKHKGDVAFDSAKLPSLLPLLISA
jgi:hypothetical protein